MPQAFVWCSLGEFDLGYGGRIHPSAGFHLIPCHSLPKRTQATIRQIRKGDNSASSNARCCREPFCAVRGEATAYSSGKSQFLTLVESHQKGIESEIARSEPTDDKVLPIVEAELDPRPGALAFFMMAIRPLGNDPLQSVFSREPLKRFQLV